MRREKKKRWLNGDALVIRWQHDGGYVETWRHNNNIGVRGRDDGERGRQIGGERWGRGCPRDNDGGAKVLMRRGGRRWRNKGKIKRKGGGRRESTTYYIDECYQLLKFVSNYRWIFTDEHLLTNSDRR